MRLIAKRDWLTGHAAGGKLVGATIVGGCCEIGPAHIHDLYSSIAPRPAGFAEALARLALAGVDDNPGGQDNIALVAVRA